MGGGDALIKELLNDSIHSSELQSGVWWMIRSSVLDGINTLGTHGKWEVKSWRLFQHIASAANIFPTGNACSWKYEFVECCIETDKLYKVTEHVAYLLTFFVALIPLLNRSHGRKHADQTSYCPIGCCKNYGSQLLHHNQPGRPWRWPSNMEPASRYVESSTTTCTRGIRKDTRGWNQWWHSMLYSTSVEMLTTNIGQLVP